VHLSVDRAGRTGWHPSRLICGRICHLLHPLDGALALDNEGREEREEVVTYIRQRECLKIRVDVRVHDCVREILFG